MKRRYRILFPHPIGCKLRTPESDDISHWIVSMNGQDHVAVRPSGKRVRGVFRKPEFKPQYNLIMRIIKMIARWVAYLAAIAVFFLIIEKLFGGGEWI